MTNAEERAESLAQALAQLMTVAQAIQNILKLQRPLAYSERQYLVDVLTKDIAAAKAALRVRAKESETPTASAK